MPSRRREADIMATDIIVPVSDLNCDREIRVSGAVITRHYSAYFGSNGWQPPEGGDLECDSATWIDTGGELTEDEWDRHYLTILDDFCEIDT